MKMSYMWLAGLIVMLGVLLTPVVNNFGPKSIDSHWQQEGVYVQAQDLIEGYLLSNVALSENRALQQALRQTITATYIQDKAVRILEDSFAWIRGQSQVGPKLDVNDLKQELHAHYPQSEQLDQALRQLGQASSKVDTLPQVTADPTLQHGLEELLQQPKTLSWLADGQAVIDLQPFAKPLKVVYWVWLAMTILGLMVVILSLILPLKGSQPWSVRLADLSRKLLWVGGLATVFSLILYGLGLKLVVAQGLSYVVERQALAGSLARGLWLALTEGYVVVALSLGLGLVVVGLGLKIMSRKQSIEPEFHSPIVDNSSVI